MSGLGFWPRLVLAVLATWRVSHLLANEDGPAGLIARARVRLGSGLAGQLMDCFHCVSVWVAAPMAWFVTRNPSDLPVTWLALSGAACLLERAGRGPVVIRPLSDAARGEVSDGMLRPEAGEPAEFIGGADGAARFPAYRAQ
jgi:hypothetical protein